MSVLAEVTRGNVVESLHRGTVVVADAAGNTIAGVGDGEIVAYFRSCAKPFQSVPPVRSAAVGDETGSGVLTASYATSG